MIFVKHNALETEFRSITGAVALGDSLRLRVHVSRRIHSTGAKLHVLGHDSFSKQMHFAGLYGEFDVYETDISLSKTGIWSYHFSLSGVENEKFIGLNGTEASLFYDNVRSWQLSCYRQNYKLPLRCENKVMYHVFVDRFFRGADTPFPAHGIMRKWGEQPFWKPDSNGKILNNDFFGGNLQGVISKLPYLKRLNVGLIYLSPIFKAKSNHKYDTGDYLTIDPLFGTEKDLRELVLKAKELNMGIVLDGVFNHCGSDSIYFNKEENYDGVGAYTDVNSPYANWFVFRKHPDDYLCWWGFETLPTFNSASEEVKIFIEKVVGKWTSLGISGWRLDVVDELSDDILNRLVFQTKKVNPDALIIGEVWEDASNKVSYGKQRRYFEGSQLDSTMNYPLRDAIVYYLRSGDSAILAQVCFDQSNNCPQHVLHQTMNILGTHDTDRILTALAGKNLRGCSRMVKAETVLTEEQREKGKKLQKIAALLTYTMCGFPCVYYGDEAGLEGYNDPFNRKCYPWNSADVELIEFYEKMGQIRNREEFSSSPYTPVLSRNGLFAFMRGNILIAVNAGTSGEMLELGTQTTSLFTKKHCDGTLFLNPLEFEILTVLPSKNGRDK